MRHIVKPPRPYIMTTSAMFWPHNPFSFPRKYPDDNHSVPADDPGPRPLRPLSFLPRQWD